MAEIVKYSGDKTESVAATCCRGEVIEPQEVALKSILRTLISSPLTHRIASHSFHPSIWFWGRFPFLHSPDSFFFFRNFEERVSRGVGCGGW